MYIIQMKIDELASSRGHEIQKLLQPITKLRSGPACEKTKRTTKDIIIGTYDGVRPTSEYRDWRFKTFVPSFWGMYFELWKRSEDDDKFWYLFQAYLTIYQIINRQQNEFLCLHCDPNGSNGSDNLDGKPTKDKKELHSTKDKLSKVDKPDREKYKKGPHLHIKAANEPLPHAHIALNLGHLDAVLESIETLSEAMQCAIFMLKEEVLDIL